MGLLRSIAELDLTPPDHYEDLQIWLKRNFELLQQHVIAGEICLSAYDAQPARASETNLHGGWRWITTGTITAASPLLVNNGLGKLYIFPAAGSDFTGDIVVTGTKVDRVTGVQTPGFTETLTIAQLGTDNTSVDANGNAIHNYQNGKITREWYLDQVTLSTVAPADVNLSSVEVYNVAFEQLNDTQFNVVNAFDVSLLVTNTLGRFDGYLYSVVVDSNTQDADIADIAHLNLGIPPYVGYYRLRKANLDISLNGMTDGIFVQMHYPASPARIEDVTCKIWLNNPTG